MHASVQPIGLAAAIDTRLNLRVQSQSTASLDLHVDLYTSEFAPTCRIV